MSSAKSHVASEPKTEAYFSTRSAQSERCYVQSANSLETRGRHCEGSMGAARSAEPAVTRGSLTLHYLSYDRQLSTAIEYERRQSKLAWPPLSMGAAEVERIGMADADGWNKFSLSVWLIAPPTLR